MLLRMVVLLLSGVLAATVTSAAQISEQKLHFNMPATYTDRSVGMEFVLVKGDCFDMGDIFGDGNDDEKPVHEVCLDDFYLGKYEVTQDQYQKITGNNPSDFKGGSRPVERVSWNDTRDFIHKLNDTSGLNYRLPTEAEWEYAARSGGKREKWAGTNNESALESYAQYGAKETLSVGQKEPNGLGLHDMSGNVWEWCFDRYDKNYYRQSPRSNPKGPVTGAGRVIRGGSWLSHAINVRTTDRFGYGPGIRHRNTPGNRYMNLGFRLLLPADQFPNFPANSISRSLSQICEGDFS